MVRQVIVFRGVPGSGKTTQAEQYFYDMLGYGKVVYCNRDEIRRETVTRLLKMGEDFGLDIPNYLYPNEDQIEQCYQLSFRDKRIDKIVSEEWWYEVMACLQSDVDTVIIDFTCIDFFDISTLADMIRQSDRVSICFECTGKYKSIHDVPDFVMMKFKKCQENTRGLVKKVFDKFQYI